MQLVASRRGIAALPNWGIQSYVEHEYVIAKPISAQGLWSELHALGMPDVMARPYTQELARIIRDTCMEKLSEIRLL